MAAFTEEGAAPSIPGPFIRVPAGTTVSVSVTNDLTDTLFISGLRDPAKWDSLVVPPGKRGAARFTATRAGVFVYQGSTLAAGVAHRLRIINITAGDQVSLDISQDGSSITARRMAKDGMDLPPNQATSVPARFNIAEGETMDFEITPRRGDLKIVVRSFNNFESHVIVR